jgi:hypothetical protein
MIGTIHEHPGAEDQASGQSQLLQVRGARGRGNAGAHDKHRPEAGDVGDAEQDIAGQYPCPCYHAPGAPFRKGRIPPEHAECDRHADKQRQRGEEAEQDGEAGNQLDSFDEVEQVGVKQRIEHLCCKRVGAAGSRLWIDMVEMLETGWNHPGCVPEPHEPDHVLHGTPGSEFRVRSMPPGRLYSPICCRQYSPATTMSSDVTPRHRAAERQHALNGEGALIAEIE